MSPTRRLAAILAADVAGYSRLIEVPDTNYLRNPEHRELFLSGLRLAVGET
jgi:hypothetical protein